jgi:hypothetical protein
MTMKKHFTFATIVFLSGLILVGQHTAMADSPVNCQTMLKPFFDYAKKGYLDGSGDFKEFAVVYATVTQHTIRATDMDRTIVFYGEAFNANEKPFQLDSKTLALRWYIGTYVNDKSPVPTMGQFSHVITISETGNVAVQQMLGKSPFIGHGPTNFVGTCYKLGDTIGMITTFLDSTNSIGEGVYTITLVQGKTIHG